MSADTSKTTAPRFERGWRKDADQISVEDVQREWAASDADADKPCPFCWSEDVEPTDQSCTSPPLRVIACRNCGAEGPVAQTDDKAWERWNRRDNALWKGNEDG
jgi:Lar family restriction alleviation protein